MAYKVTRLFYDMQDSAHLYNVGDSFPRKGLAVSEKRIAELAGNKNRLHQALIVEVKEEAPKKTTTRRKKGE